MKEVISNEQLENIQTEYCFKQLDNKLYIIDNDEIISIIIETPQPDGPSGARGMGEHTMIPAAPMIANAVEDALGIRIKSMPITAEKIALTVVKENVKSELINAQIKVLTV